MALDLPRPAPNPGPQRDIAMTQLASGADLSAVAGRIPDLAWSGATVGEPCRIDWIDRCHWVSETLADTLYDALRSAGIEPSQHVEPYFYVSQFGPADRLIVSRTASFGGGTFTIVNALADRDGRIGQIVTVTISQEVHGVATGDAAANMAVLAATQDEDGAVYLTIDTPSRCGDEPRRAGLLVKTDVDVAKVAWVSPFNVSDTNAVLRGGRLYTASGGSCERDYLYEVDAATGRVTGRTVLPTAADFLVGAGDHLLVDLYEGALGYGFR